MAIRIVRLGTPRQPGEGVRIGTVRRPPRGVPRSRFAVDNWYDVWLPGVAPSTELLSEARKRGGPERWKGFAQRYRSEMSKSDASTLLDLLAALSHRADFSVGCYCENEDDCHRSILRELLSERGAKTDRGSMASERSMTSPKKKSKSSRS